MCLAIPGQIIDIQRGEDPAFRSGKVSFSGIVKNVNLSLVPEAKVNDYVLVHVGVALNRIDETEAQRVFQYLDEIGEVEEQLSQKSKKVK